MEGSDAWTHGMRSPINAAQDGFDPRADSLFQSTVFLNSLVLLVLFLRYIYALLCSSI